MFRVVVDKVSGGNDSQGGNGARRETYINTTPGKDGRRVGGWRNHKRDVVIGRNGGNRQEKLPTILRFRINSRRLHPPRRPCTSIWTMRTRTSPWMVMRCSDSSNYRWPCSRWLFPINYLGANNSPSPLFHLHFSLFFTFRQGQGSGGSVVAAYQQRGQSVVDSVVVVNAAAAYAIRAVAFNATPFAYAFSRIG